MSLLVIDHWWEWRWHSPFLVCPFSWQERSNLGHNNPATNRNTTPGSWANFTSWFGSRNNDKVNPGTGRELSIDRRTLRKTNQQAPYRSKMNRKLGCQELVSRSPWHHQWTDRPTLPAGYVLDVFIHFGSSCDANVQQRLEFKFRTVRGSGGTRMIPSGRPGLVGDKLYG